MAKDQPAVGQPDWIETVGSSKWAFDNLSPSSVQFGHEFVLVRHKFDDLSPNFIDIMKYVLIWVKIVWGRYLFIIIGIDRSSSYPHRH